MIYFDLDGVLRDLISPLFHVKDVRFWNVENQFGQNFLDLVNRNLDVLLHAPCTEYVDVWKKFKGIIITKQPLQWKFLTSVWISVNLGKADVLYVEDGESKLQYLKDGDYLVEDYPYFEDYSKIILIDHLYNREVKHPFARVKNARGLARILSRLSK